MKQGLGNSLVLKLTTIGFLFAGLMGCSQQAPENGALSKVDSFDQFANSEKGAVHADPATCDANCVKRRQEFRYVVYVGKQIYCYWDLKRADTGTDFDALAASLEKGIVTETSYSQYYKILRKWASAFHDGHVNVMAKDDLTDLEIYTSPVRLEVMAPASDHEQVLVTQVAAGTPGGISVGDRVIAVGGVPVTEVLNRAVDESSSGSTPAMRRYWAARRLVDVIGSDVGDQPLVLTVRSVLGVERTVSVARSVEIDTKPVPGAAAEADTGLANFTSRVLPGGWGYFRLDAFGGSQDDALIGAAMNRLAGTQGLILDLRHNGGGDLSGDRIIERLITAQVVRYKRSERLSDFLLNERAGDNFALTPDATGLFAVWHDLTVDPLANHHYAKPVVALISPYCFSACDTFSSSLKANHLATFIGEPTGGGTGTPYVFNLPVSPLAFRYSVIRGQSPAGNLIEGAPTQPDVAIEPSLDDRVNNHDAQLGRAIEVLQGLTGGKHEAITVPVMAPIWSQDLDTSPTADEIRMIQKISHADSIGG